MQKKGDYLAPKLINTCQKFVFLRPSKTKAMVIELLVVWVIGVVAFFVLWAILAKVIQRISEKSQQKRHDSDENAPKAPFSGEIS